MGWVLVVSILEFFILPTFRWHLCHHLDHHHFLSSSSSLSSSRIVIIFMGQDGSFLLLAWGFLWATVLQPEYIHHNQWSHPKCHHRHRGLYWPWENVTFTAKLYKLGQSILAAHGTFWTSLKVELRSVLSTHIVLCLGLYKPPNVMLPV